MLKDKIYTRVMFRKVPVICLILLFVAHQLYAQTGAIGGRATDSLENKPLEFVSVILLSAEDSVLVKGGITDSTGQFVINNLHEGKYLLVLNSVEYNQQFRGPLVIGKQAVLNLGNIKLLKKTSSLKEISVTGSIPVFQRKLGSIVMNVNNRFFKTSPNILDLLKMAPGVTITQAGDLLMRNAITPAIFIDGKDVQMSSVELNNYLKSLRPDEIEAIEIIQNPSSKYDAQYAGIIDIKLKKDKNLGWSGSMSASYHQNIYASIVNNLNLTYKSKRSAYTGRIGFTSAGTINKYSGKQILGNQDVLYNNTQNSTFFQIPTFQLGFNHTLSKNQSLNGTIRGLTRNGSGRLLTESFFEKNAWKNIDQVLHSTRSYTGLSGNINYELNLKRSKLNIAASLVNYNVNDRQNLINNGIDSLSSTWRANLINKYVIRSAQADYSKELAGGKLEVGSKLAVINTRNKTQYDKYETSIWSIDLSRSNKFLYEERTVAGYMSYSKQFKELTYNGSLRIENTNSIANSPLENRTTQRNYFKWLPSFSIHCAIDKSQSFTVEVSRKLRRPYFDELNPFRLYTSSLSYQEGNPYLEPQERNLITLGYNYKSIYLSLSAGKEIKPIKQLQFFDSTNRITSFLQRNLDSYTSYSSSISYPFTISKSWNMQHNLSGYLNNSKITYFNKLYRRYVFNFILNGSHNFTLPHKTTLNVSYSYYSPGGDALNAVRSFYWIDLGLQKQFLFNKLNVRINMYDIFYQLKYSGYFRASDLINSSYSTRSGSRSLNIQLTYNLGKSIYKARQVKSSSAEEESRTGK